MYGIAGGRFLVRVTHWQERNGEIKRQGFSKGCSGRLLSPQAEECSGTPPLGQSIRTTKASAPGAAWMKVTFAFSGSRESESSAASV